MKLSRYEQETIVNFNEDDDSADIYTHNSKWKKRLAQLKKEHPAACQFVSKNLEGGVSYRVDKKLVSLRTPYSEERRQKDRERALAANRQPPTRNAGEDE